MTKAQAKQRLAKLRREIDHHRYLYHVLDEAEISAAALDSLKHELQQLEDAYPDLITPDSPSQRVGGKPLAKFQEVPHSVPMLSLRDAFTEEELVAWEVRNQKIIPGTYDYFVQQKIDGVAIALIYENGVLVQALTRGDGRVGEDVTHNIRTIESIPLSLRPSPPKPRLWRGRRRVEIRGEVYMLKADLARLNRERLKAGLAPFANPRNLAAGSMRQLDPTLAAARPLRFMAWEITEGFPVKTRVAEYEALRDLGFHRPPQSQHCQNLQEAWQILQQEEKRREKYPYLVDGAVIKINDLATSRRLGTIGKTPRGSIAYKFAAAEATTTVTDIVVQVGRTGSLTPVAHLAPTAVAGTTVSRATLHNAGEIARKDIRIGDTVIIRKAGDIIPEVVRVLPVLRPRSAKQFAMPRRCPICGAAVTREAEGAIYRCSNTQCFPQQRERILHTVSSEAFNIEGLGDKIVEQLLQEGLIKDAPDLWEVTVGDLTPLERFADTSARKLVQEIQQHKTITLARFLVGLSIPLVGTVTAQDLAREFKTLTKLQAASITELEAIEGVGPKVARTIHTFWQDPHHREVISRYAAVGVTITPEATAGPWAGKTFVFTGNLEALTREEAKHLVQQRGGKVAGTPGEKVDFVVVGKDPGTKAAKAGQLNLTILTEKQFKQMLSSNG